MSSSNTNRTIQSFPIGPPYMNVWPEKAEKVIRICPETDARAVSTSKGVVMAVRERKRKKFPGLFVIEGRADVIGELHINGDRTLLTVHTDHQPPFLEPNADLYGRAYDGIHISLIDCIPAGSWTTYPETTSAPLRHRASYFPHFVVLGDRHLESTSQSVHSIHFCTSDLSALFYDFDAFSHLIDARPHIEDLLKERRKLRPIEVGQFPEIAYFTGKSNIADIETCVGRISVDHRPMSNLGGPDGVYIKNRIQVSVHFSEPVAFAVATKAMTDVVGFLSAAAGRIQDVKRIHIGMGSADEEYVPCLTVIPSYKWRGKSESEHHKPHPGDVPLDPVRRPEEFGNVLSDWLARQEDWRVARSSSLSCLRDGNSYAPSRLVEAANMFDLLPFSAVPISSALADGMEAAKNKCLDILRQQPKSADRESALDALGRVGRPSLPKRALYRCEIVSAKMGSRLPELGLVIRQAIKCRNYFVHGSDDFNYPLMSEHLSFLTDALEFVFTASDFLEAGWDPEHWLSGGLGYGHSFSRFGIGYREKLARLQKTLKNLNAAGG